MDNLYFIPNNILTNLFKELAKHKNDYQQYLSYIYIYIYIEFILYILLYPCICIELQANVNVIVILYVCKFKVCTYM